ncbi:MAG: Type secretion system protein [Firmicutes bacterium]|nr:Type secretion system protein [Bacillota bacterium]
MLIVALLSGMLAFLLFLLLIEYFTRGKTKISRKVRRYTGTTAEIDYANKKPDSIEKFMKFIRYMGLKVRGTPQTKGLETKMQQAGLPLLGSEFLVIMGVVALVFGVMGMMVTLKILYAVLLGICAPIVCFLYLNIRIARRRVAVSNQLGDALSMMSNAMRSGFSFMQAMDLIEKEMKPPISVEFFKTIAEIRLGADAETALLNMGRRVQSSDLDLVITAVLIQRQVGGNLAQILDTIAGTINERIKMKREIKTLTAQGRLSGWVLAALPFGVGGLLSIINPSYLKPLFDEPMGQMMVIGALIFELIGFLIIRKIVMLDV